MADDGYHLACHQHGALYRSSDGPCTSGPCVGASLVRIDFDDAGGGSFVLRFDP